MLHHFQQQNNSKTYRYDFERQLYVNMNPACKRDQGAVVSMVG